MLSWDSSRCLAYCAWQTVLGNVKWSVRGNPHEVSWLLCNQFFPVPEYRVAFARISQFIVFSFLEYDINLIASYDIQ
jgi:hypothetical protein